MVAQAFVWRSTEDDLVLDSVECLSGHEEAVAPLFVEAAKQALGRLCVRRVAVGDSSYGATQEVARHGLKKAAAPTPTFRMSYTDVRGGVLVLAEADLPKAVVQKTIEEAQEVPPASVNALMEGSGVFCEHCDAEIHPDCEICPSCGENIAEWVEED